MKRVIFIMSFALSSALMTIPAAARDIEHLDTNIPADANIRNANLEADIGLARIRIDTREGGDIIEGHVRYDADKFRVDIEHDSQGDDLDIFLFSEQARRKLNLDSDDNDWQINLSRDCRWDIDLEMGFAECLLDLSGLPITNLVMDIGASECEVEFGLPNPERASLIDIDAGAGEVAIKGLGYANFEEFRFDGGAGDFVLNFEGDYSEFRRARIDVGVGAIRLELPRNLPVRIETSDGWLNSFSLRGARLTEVDDGVYETKDFDKAQFGLEIELDLGIGEAEITWVR